MKTHSTLGNPDQQVALVFNWLPKTLHAGPSRDKINNAFQV